MLGSGRVCSAGLEGHLQNPFPEPVPVQASDSDGRLLVAAHGHEAEAFALVCAEVSYDLDVDDGAERAEDLPEDALVCVRGEIIHEDTPAGGVREADSIDGHGRESAGRNEFS